MVSKKKNEQTLGDLLSEAVIEKDSHLFQLPDNWEMVKFGEVALLTDYVANGSFASLKENVKVYDEDEHAYYVRLYDLRRGIGHLEQKFVDQVSYEYLSKSYLKGGEILLSSVGSVGAVYLMPILDKKATIAPNMIISRMNKRINNEFAYYFFKSPMGQEALENISSGTTQKKINKTNLKTIAFPLPSKEEQNRIVSKLNKLFIKIDRAQQLIEEAKKTFEIRRAAILDMAFRGGRSRDFKGLPNGWEYKKFDEIATVKSNLVNPNDYLEYPHIAPDNIEKHTGRLLDYKTIREDNVKSAKHYFTSGAILYSKIRPYLSKVAMVDFEGLCSADMYPIESQLNSKYLYWFMLSPLFLEQATTAGSRSVLPKINQKELGKVMVPVCSNEEQEKTVEIIESVLKEENINLYRIENSLDELKLLKQSILFKAFKGEFGTDHPNDELAMELLKSILQEKLY